MSSAMSGTMLLRGERWRSMVPLRHGGGRSTGLSVATLARRPFGPVFGDMWPTFVIFRDALQRRDDVLRCNITVAFSHPWKTNAKWVTRSKVLADPRTGNYQKLYPNSMTSPIKKLSQKSHDMKMSEFGPLTLARVDSFYLYCSNLRLRLKLSI